MNSRSDLFLVESEDSISGSSERACELCGSASKMPSVSASSQSTGQKSLAIPTCVPLWPTPKATERQQRNSRDKWVSLSAAIRDTSFCPCRCHTSMSSVAASPVKISAPLVRERGSKGRARVFGQSTPASLANYDRDTSLWRMLQSSFLEGLDEFSETWPRSGMTRNGTAYQLQPLAPLTGVIGSGLWPTPRVSMAHGPSQREIAETSPTTGSLNPEFVEWLMGFPIGWTDLSLSGTPSSLKLPNGSAKE
jgi:hypothetical protein